MTYLTELAVDFENASSLIPLEITQAPALGELSKDEFINGWRNV
jgi:DCN1-like protein 1/2